MEYSCTGRCNNGVGVGINGLCVGGPPLNGAQWGCMQIKAHRDHPPCPKTAARHLATSSTGSVDSPLTEQFDPIIRVFANMYI